MKNYETFLVIREKISEDERRIPALQNELLNKQRAQPQLDEEARRAWALDEPGAAKLKATAEENEKAVIRLEEELKKLKLRVELMKKDSVSAQEAAIRDLQIHYRGLVGPLVKEWVKRLLAALEVEKQLEVLQDESSAKLGQVTPYPRIVWPTYTHFLIPPEGIRSFKYGPLGRVLKGLKDDGFDVGEDLK